MKNIKEYICALLIVGSFLTMIGSAIASIVIRFQNPDMTDVRLLLTYPELAIIAISAAIVLAISVKIFTHNKK